jgi:hypothetical protein
MEMQRKSMGRSVRDGSRRFLTVSLPQPHEGVGNALRSSFRASRDSLPDDMMDLLNKLDHH